MPTGDFPPPEGMVWTDANGYVPKPGPQFATALDELLTLRSEVAQLRSALEPFAKISLWRDKYPDAKSDILTARQLQGYIKVEDVRAARAALKNG